MTWRPEPSGLAVQPWNPNPRSRAQFHRTFPLEVQAGPQSSAGTRLTSCWPDPFAFITKTSLFSSRMDRDAIFVPSRDHAGSKASWRVGGSRPVAGADGGSDQPLADPPRELRLPPVYG